MSGFSMDKQFFVIDSKNAAQTKTQLYGFAINGDEFLEHDDRMGDEELSGDGAYVFVRRSENRIVISQDSMGSFGLYVFRHGEYFALSNSFMLLVDYVKNQYELTLNKAFADALIVSSLCSVSYEETLIREIRALDRSAVVEIDIAPVPVLCCRYIDYEENTVDIDSAQGLQILDDWYQRWTGLIRKVYESGTKIRCDLSGGFDSRITFALFLGSGINLNDIYVCSIDDGLHTHTEDYEIASEISRHFGFALNNMNAYKTVNTPHDMDDILDISFYLKLGFHKQMYFMINECERKKAFFSGGGGECIRGYWTMSKEEYVKNELKHCKAVMGNRAEQHMDAVRDLLENSFRGISEKFARHGRKIDEKDMTLNFYRETRCRNHFGKDRLESYCSGVIKYCPLLDRELHKLKLSSGKCWDRNLLMALIFVRYQPELLDFRIEGKRRIDTQTIAYAERINEEYPLIKTDMHRGAICEADRIDEHQAAGRRKKKMVKKAEVEAYVEKAFYSEKLKKDFVSVYDEDVYDYMCADIETRTYKPLEFAVTGLAIGRAAAATRCAAQSGDTVSQYIRECVISGKANRSRKQKAKYFIRRKKAECKAWCKQLVKKRTFAWIKRLIRNGL